MAEADRNPDNVNEAQDSPITEVNKASVVPQTERYGEVEPNPDAETQGLQEQSREERLDAAKREALNNHAAEHSTDEAEYETMVNNDKVEDEG